MKDANDKAERIAYKKVAKADRTLKSAALLIEHEMWDDAINRLYYSCFHIVSALLLKYDIRAKSHSGVKTMFFVQFLKTKKLDLKYGKLYTDLVNWRESSDYGDFLDFPKDIVEPLLKPCEEFIERIKEEIEKTENQ